MLWLHSWYVPHGPAWHDDPLLVRQHTPASAHVAELTQRSDPLASSPAESMSEVASPVVVAASVSGVVVPLSEADPAPESAGGALEDDPLHAAATIALARTIVRRVVFRSFMGPLERNCAIRGAILTDR